MFHRLLICTDFLDGLQRLAQFVPSLAAANIQQITFLHCVPLNECAAIPRADTEKVEQARQYLEAGLRQAIEGVTVTIEVKSGRPTDLILKVAQDYQADLIWMGFPIHSSFSESLFGSTMKYIFERTKIPILVIRPQLISTYTSEELDLRCRHLFRHLMLPYDGSDGAKYLIHQIKQHLSEPSERVLEACNLCWTIDDVERRDIPQEPYIKAAQAALAGVKTELEALNLRVETEVRLGSAVVEVLKASLQPDVSAIAVSPNPRNRFLQLSVPSFTSDLLRQSWHPVLFFPKDR